MTDELERRLAAVLDRTIWNDDPIMDADYLPREAAPAALIGILLEYGVDRRLAETMAADLIRSFETTEADLIAFLEGQGRSRSGGELEI